MELKFEENLTLPKSFNVPSIETGYPVDVTWNTFPLWLLCVMLAVVVLAILFYGFLKFKKRYPDFLGRLFSGDW